eukprot:13133805-Alexandrium_andersonii.AAC.1
MQLAGIREKTASCVGPPTPADIAAVRLWLFPLQACKRPTGVPMASIESVPFRHVRCLPLKERRRAEEFVSWSARRFFGVVMQKTLAVAVFGVISTRIEARDLAGDLQRESRMQLVAASNVKVACLPCDFQCSGTSLGNMRLCPRRSPAIQRGK